MVNEECSITFPLYSLSWNHYIFNLDSFYLYPVKRGIVRLHISPCRSSHNSWCFSCLLPCFCVLDCAYVSLVWVLHPWARVEWKYDSSYTVTHSSSSSDFVLLKSRPLMPWTIQHLGWTIKAISIFLILCGIQICSTLLEKVLSRCS